MVYQLRHGSHFTILEKEKKVRFIEGNSCTLPIVDPISGQWRRWWRWWWLLLANGHVSIMIRFQHHTRTFRREWVSEFPLPKKKRRKHEGWRRNSSKTALGLWWSLIKARNVLFGKLIPYIGWILPPKDVAGQRLFADSGVVQFARVGRSGFSGQKSTPLMECRTRSNCGTEGSGFWQISTYFINFDLIKNNFLNIQKIYLMSLGKIAPPRISNSRRVSLFFHWPFKTLASILPSNDSVPVAVVNLTEKLTDDRPKPLRKRPLFQKFPDL